MRLARMLQAAARPMGAMARPSGPLPVATTGARSAVPWNGQGGHSTWHRRWSAAAATDVEYRDRPNQQPVPPIAHGTTRLETLVDPGSLFKVELPHCKADVQVVIGALDRIVCELVAPENTPSAVVPVMTACGPEGDDGASNTLQVTAAAGGNKGGGGVTVRAWIPERFCTVQVSTAGGTVEVAGVTEGHLTVSSSGGEVTLGKVRSATAHVHTGGGQLNANVLSAMLTLDTGGGACTVKRLVGGQLDVSTGALTAAVVYGDDVRIRCTSAVIEQMQVGRHATLAASAGGAVAVHGLDGSAAITTDGGDVVVQLQERSRSVEVNSGGGDVEVRVPEAVTGGVHLCATGQAGVRVVAPLHCDGDAGGTCAQGRLHGVGEGGTAHRLMVQERISLEEREGGDAEGAACCVMVDAAAGCVVVERRSWFQARFGRTPPSCTR